MKPEGNPFLKNEFVSHKGREYHLRLDDMTGMRQKELLYLPEGVEYLKDKFEDTLEIILGDVSGVGVANEMLRREGEDILVARKNVDDCFVLLNTVVDEVYGENKNIRPFEIVRVGGDEIIFIGCENDERLVEVFSQFTVQKEKFLKERIGEEAYHKATFETNIKSQMKLITKEPEYLALVETGDIEALNAWFHSQLGEHSRSEKRMSNLLRDLAQVRLETLPQEDWFAPLDFYLSRPQRISLDKDIEYVRVNLMQSLAFADADIAWNKAHPGHYISDTHVYDAKSIVETAEKYLNQAKEVEGVTRKIQEKERALIKAREAGKNLQGEKLKLEIIRLETTDAGTGAIRLDKSASKRLVDLVEFSRPERKVEMFRLDVPYFGVYNNHYDYATADEMMKQLVNEMRATFHGVIVRDGGTLFVLKEAGGESVETEEFEVRANALLAEFTESEDPKKRSAMKNEVAVKRAITRSRDVFGKVKITSPTFSQSVSTETTLSDIIRIIA